MHRIASGSDGYKYTNKHTKATRSADVYITSYVKEQNRYVIFRDDAIRRDIPIAQWISQEQQLNVPSN